MTYTKGRRGYGPCPPVHQTILQAHPIAIENTDHRCMPLHVHLNEFQWTHYAHHEGNKRV